MFDPLRHKAKVATSTALTFLLGIGVAAGLGWTAPGFSMPDVSETPTVAEEDVRSVMDLSDAFVSLSDAVTPAVVRIEVQRRREMTRRQLPIPDEFRRFFPDQPEDDDGRPNFSLSGGSGFIISEDGYILTNDHVVSGAEEIRVWTRDRRDFPATLVGTDPSTDVAVIKIDQTGLPTLPFGDSDEVRVGEWVLAVGNPGFGPASQLDYTVTSGIVSARGRGLQLIQRELRRNPDFGEDMAGYAIEDYIQTDAVINQGNSGGPMVNLRGQVIGINSAIASRTGAWQGYGFAIPVNLARRVMQDLIEYGHVQRPRLGVQISEVTAEAADYNNLPSVAGVLIQEAQAGTPAAEAGLQRGDVIVAIDGEPVERVPSLQYRVAQHRPGDVVELRYYRDGEPRTTRVRLGEAPINEVEEREPTPPSTAEGRLGIEVQDLTPQLNRDLGYDEVGGVVITDVDPLGPAARRGVGPGAKILEINGQEVADQEDMQDILDRAAGDEVVAVLLTDPSGSTRIVHLRMGR